MRILFLAPLKVPDHPIPSGDRTIARLFWRTLENMGYEVVLASRLRSYNPAPDDAHWRGLQAASTAEIVRIMAEEAAKPHKPLAAVFTYHLYYKAPDVIGPALARALNVPYILAEASRAPRRKREAQAADNPALVYAHDLVEEAIHAARLLITPSLVDREMLEAVVQPHQTILDLKPFLDLSLWAGTRTLPRPKNPAPRFLTVAMMREGDKRASYRALAEALLPLQSAAWTLDLVGDGGSRSEIEAAFAPFGSRIHFLGVLEGDALGEAYAKADAFLWPAINEAFGMVLLEAQAHGLPVIAGDYGGVREVVQHGITGLLTPREDIPAFTNAIASLLSNPARRAEMGKAARLFVEQGRSVTQAVTQLRDAFTACGVKANPTLRPSL